MIYQIKVAERWQRTFTVFADNEEEAKASVERIVGNVHDGVRALVDVDPAEEWTVEERQQTRSCDGCTQCCTVFGVTELNKPNFTRCGHETESDGCTIYKDRPRSCRRFTCLWAMGMLPQEDSPDKLGVIFSPTRDEHGACIAVGEVRPGAIQQTRAKTIAQRVSVIGRLYLLSPKDDELVRLTVVNQ